MAKLNAEPTALDYLGFTMAVEEARKTNAVIPAWGCTSEATRAEYRQKALDAVRVTSRMGVMMNEVGANRLLLDVPQVAGEFERWKAFEEKLEDDRAANNPQAFFFHTR